MRKLIEFLVRKRHWFLFVLLEAVSLLLLYRGNRYQQTVMLSSANMLTGSVVSLSGSVASYLNLRDINKDLLERNGRLEARMLSLQDQLEMLMADTVTFRGFVPDTTDSIPYTFVVADVVNNSVVRLFNYITINKGKLDGIEPDMGVVCERGAVGIVSTVSDHFSVVIPLLNPKLRLSCKVQGSGYFGSLNWDGRDALYANLEELPRHVDFQKGDTVVTSGYSTVFPEGVMVGTVDDMSDSHDGLSYLLKIKLATDFGKVSHVRVISRGGQEEQKEIEKGY